MASNHVDLPRIAAGESCTVPFDVDESIQGWSISARFGSERGGVPYVEKTTAGTGTSQVVIPAGTAGTGYFQLTATDTGRTLGPGIWAFSLWRTDGGLEARLAWGDLVIGKTVAALPG